MLFFMPTLATNKEARFNYDILEEHEAGLILTGAETKSVKLSHISLRGAYITHQNNELWLKNCYIASYQEKNQPHYEDRHLRKLLLKRKEIDSLMGKMKQQGLTLLPLNVYTKKALIKVKIGLAKGRKKYDKRQIIKKREADRKINRALRQKA